MKDDFNSAFVPGNRFAGIRMQQGEVPLDDDWNSGSGEAAGMARKVLASFDGVDLASRADALVNAAALESLHTESPGQVPHLDPATGSVRFGDGEAGRVPPTGASIEAGYRTGTGAVGGVATAIFSTLPPFPTALASPEPVEVELLNHFAAVADKLSAYQDRIVGEAHLESGRGGSHTEPESDTLRLVRQLAAVLDEFLSLGKTLGDRLERQQPGGSSSSGDED